MQTLRTALFSLFLISSIHPWATGQNFKPADSLSQLDMLVGHWFADASGAQNKGTFSFSKELGGTILVRRDHTEVPSSAGHEVAPHDILMIVYQDREQGLQAVYFDNEGNNATLKVLFATAGQSVQFSNEASSEHAGLRLTYTSQPTGKLAIKFEMEPPGSTNAFATVAQGLAHR